MKKYFFLVVFYVCIFTQLSFAQAVIKGRVVQATTETAIPGCSVFISNTSIGTVTDARGNFELTNVPVGNYELVVSSIGFETNVYSYKASQLPLQMKIELAQKIKELETVLVEKYIEEGWDKWGKTFLENFIGTTSTADKCSIKNKDKIRFRYYRKSNRLIAFADEPLMIDNSALGYQVKYQLENFEINFSSHTTFYLGYAFFTDKAKEGKEPKMRWQRNRNEAFQGSVTHFMQALFHNNLLAQGFEVRRMKRIYNFEKQRVKEVFRRQVTNAAKEGKVIHMDVQNNGEGATDSSEYYRRVLKQGDFTDVYEKQLITSDSILYKTDEKDKQYYFEDYLAITFKNELEEDGWLILNRENRKPFYQRSLVFLLKPETITVDSQGNYFDSQNFLTSGYWSWSEKIANLLPLGFVPGE